MILPIAEVNAARHALLPNDTYPSGRCAHSCCACAENVGTLLHAFSHRPGPVQQAAHVPCARGRWPVPATAALRPLATPRATLPAAPSASRATLMAPTHGPLCACRSQEHTADVPAMSRSRAWLGHAGTRLGQPRLTAASWSHALHTACTPPPPTLASPTNTQRRSRCLTPLRLHSHCSPTPHAEATQVATAPGSPAPFQSAMNPRPDRMR
jgi:hypothetical protein